MNQKKKIFYRPIINKSQEIINEQLQEWHEIFVEANSKMGFMFGSKALVQILVNPLIGPLTNR